MDLFDTLTWNFIQYSFLALFFPDLAIFRNLIIPMLLQCIIYGGP